MIQTNDRLAPTALAQLAAAAALILAAAAAFAATGRRTR